jgi:hypothetical protein
MTTERTNLPIETRRRVLQVGGYKCGNPECRTILTLDIHHINAVSDDVTNDPENLIALCPNCHSLHQSLESVRAWKFLLLSLNEAFDRHAADLLLSLDKTNGLWLSGDALTACGGLIATGLAEGKLVQTPIGAHQALYRLRLTERGRLFLEGWKAGNQDKAIRQLT